MKFKTLLMMCAGTMSMATNGQTNQLRLTADNIDQIVAELTTDEKLHLLLGTGMPGEDNPHAMPAVGASDKLLPGSAGTTYPVERLGIPAIALADGPAGLRISPKRAGDDQTYYCTRFPSGTLLASTWDSAVVDSVGAAMGSEVLAYGCDVLLAPGTNIMRNPLCGRNFEYFSEDPVLAGKTAAAYIKGVQSNGVGTSLKHFACNNQETCRNTTDARVSERALREIYLQPFEIAVQEANPWTVMSSYNKLNGTHTAESAKLLTDILRGDWGYEGLVMSDWFGGKDAAAMVSAGNDLLEPGMRHQYARLEEALADGSLTMADVDRSVKRVLELVVRTPRFHGYKATNAPDLQRDAQIVREAATQGMVLLKNENKALPLNSKGKVALLGMGSYATVAGGTGSGGVNNAYEVSLAEGLANAGMTLEPGMREIYETALKAKPKKPDDLYWGAFLPEEILPETAFLQNAAADADAAIITFSRSSGEFADRAVSDFSLTATEDSLLRRVARAFEGKPVVVVLNVGAPIETASWCDVPGAILCAWQPGQEGGNAMADVLTGRVNPSGRLPMTFPMTLADVPSTPNFPMLEMTRKEMLEKFSGFAGATDTTALRRNIDYADYAEDIFVGYRHFDLAPQGVAYPFGYGLSYTEFEYGQPQAKIEGDKIKYNVQVKNVGSVAGREVVPVYASAPRGALTKPLRELKGYSKTGLLQPGESEMVEISFPIASLASYDPEAEKWVRDGGTYNFSSSPKVANVSVKID